MLLTGISRRCLTIATKICVVVYLRYVVDRINTDLESGHLRSSSSAASVKCSKEIDLSVVLNLYWRYLYAYEDESEGT